MNKLTLTLMVTLSIFISCTNKGNENNFKKDIVKNDNIVETIAQEYEINSKHISYNNIKDSIYNSGIFNEFKKNISLNFGGEYEKAFGLPMFNNLEEISFKDKNYYLEKMYDYSNFEVLNGVFINDSYEKLEYIIGHMLVVSVISNIAHYDSEHNNPKNVTDSINFWY